MEEPSCVLCKLPIGKANNLNKQYNLMASQATLFLQRKEFRLSVELVKRGEKKFFLQLVRRYIKSVDKSIAIHNKLQKQIGKVNPI